MALRRRLGARRQIEQKHGYEIAAAGDMDDGAVDPEMRPERRLQRAHVEAEAFVDRNALPPAPVEIGVEHIFAGGNVLFAHVLCRSSAALTRSFLIPAPRTETMRPVALTLAM